MKLKYYLRGLGIGIIVTTIILMISFAINKTEISDAEVIERAEQLGMVMPEEESEVSEEDNSEVIETESLENIRNADAEDDTVSDMSEETLDTEETADGQDAQAVTDEKMTGSYTLIVKSGEVCRTICEDLQSNNVIDDAEAFRKYLGGVGFASSIGAGTYEIPYGLSYEEIYLVLKEGPLEARD